MIFFYIYIFNFFKYSKFNTFIPIWTKYLLYLIISICIKKMSQDMFLIYIRNLLWYDFFCILSSHQMLFFSILNLILIHWALKCIWFYSLYFYFIFLWQFLFFLAALKCLLKLNTTHAPFIWIFLLYFVVVIK